MKWFKKKQPEIVIPNPRDKRKRRDAIEQAQQNVVDVLAFFCIVMALLILAEMTNAPL